MPASPDTTVPVPDPADSDIEAVSRLMVQVYPLLVRAVLAGQERTRRDDAGVAERLSPAQVLALGVVGDRRVTISELAAGSGVRLSSATRMAQGLERMGLLERVTPAEGDRRRRMVALTPAGADALEARRVIQRRRFSELVAPLPPQARGVLADGVRVMAAALAIAAGLDGAPPRAADGADGPDDARGPARPGGGG